MCSQLSTHSGSSRCVDYLNGLKNSSSIFQNRIDNKFKEIKIVIIFRDDLVYETPHEQYEKRKPAVKEQLREKNLRSSQNQNH